MDYQVKFKRRIQKSLEIPLVVPFLGMINLFLILMVYAFKSYSTSTLLLPPAQAGKLPKASALAPLEDTLLVTVTPDTILVDSTEIVRFLSVAQPQGNGTHLTDISFYEADLDHDRKRIIPLYDFLMKSKTTSQLLLKRSAARENGKPIPFHGKILLQADRNTQYEIIQKIVKTAELAGFHYFQFAGLKDRAAQKSN